MEKDIKGFELPEETALLTFEGSRFERLPGRSIAICTTTATLSDFLN